MAPAELGDEGNELFGFVGVGTNIVVARLTPPNARRVSSCDLRRRRATERRATLEAASEDANEAQSSKTQVANGVNKSRRGPARACRQPTIRGADGHRIIHGHMQVVMSLAYRRNHQQVCIRLFVRKQAFTYKQSFFSLFPPRSMAQRSSGRLQTTKCLPTRSRRRSSGCIATRTAMMRIDRF